MRKAPDTIPVDQELLTECQPCVGRAHLRCDCPLRVTSEIDPDVLKDALAEFDEEITQVRQVRR